MEKRIKGFEDYSITDDGKVFSYKSSKPREMKQQEVRKYKYVVLSDNGNNYNKRVHRLVAENFIGDCPIDKVVNHKNGNSIDNRLDNLEYINIRENVLHCKNNELNITGVYNRPYGKFCAKLTHNGKVVLNKTFNTKEEAELIYNKKVEELGLSDRYMKRSK